MARITPPGGASQITREDAERVFEHLEPRRRGFEQVMWQVPGLSVAGQALLFTVALNPHNPLWGRITVLAAGLAGLVAAMHLMAKHRYLEELHGDVLQRCLQAMGLPGLYQDDLAQLLSAGDRSLRWRSGWRGHLVYKRSTFTVWLAAFFVFAAADVVLLGFILL